MRNIPEMSELPPAIAGVFLLQRRGLLGNHDLRVSLKQEVELIQRELVISVPPPDRTIGKNPDIIGIMLSIDCDAAKARPIYFRHSITQTDFRFQI